MNDTRVTAVRLLGRKASGAAVEALVMREVATGQYEALVKPGKRLPVGTSVSFEGGLSAWVRADLGDGLKLLEFDQGQPVAARLEEVGRVPLPPYIHSVLAEKERYQTVYSAQGGSAAAPTAGLHFTTELLDQLRERGVEVAFVTLSVGIDTFRPVQVDDLSHHKMHGETCFLPPETAEAVNSARGRIIAVGTTSVRTLESFAVGPRRVKSGHQETRIFIRPGYQFQIIDGMFTNFHLPATTMLMMLAAFVGREHVLRAYATAVRERYRFLSFGDSMLIV